MGNSEELKKLINSIAGMQDSEKRLGYAIFNELNDLTNLFDDIGGGLLRLCDREPENIEVIERVLIALTGFGFAGLKKCMIEQKDFVNSL